MSEDAGWWEDINGNRFRMAAKCGNCGVIYSTTEGLTCPACQWNCPAWATREEYPTVDFSKFDTEIAWLEALHKLEDKRDES
jgi:hypothetical protein